jgi:ADP-heptose:LPS heptosyltransferase
MNFPGLDPLWSGLHHAAHGLGLIRPWPIEEIRARLRQGEKVLVVVTTALGDSLLTMPLLETLSRHLGPERVALLVREPYVDLYRDDPRAHRVFSVRGKYRWNHLRRELKADPHRIALLSNITESDLVPCLWHGGVRGFLRYPTRWTRFPDWMANRSVLRRPGEGDYATGHAIENNLAMAAALGLEPATHRIMLPHLQKERPLKQNLVLIHPGASRAIKRWPPENWARLADALVDRFQVGISFTGDPGERPLADEIIRRMKSAAFNGAGLAPLRVLALRQAEAVAFLSGDTGPYHLALAVGCPTVTLFAPTDRGSSIEACGPHQADPVFHRAIQTAKLGDAIATIPFDRVLREALIVVGESLTRSREEP